MSPVATYWTHFIAIALFTLGLGGFLLRRNAIIVLMSLELMLNAINLLFIEVSVRTGTPDGYMFVIFIITVAATEVAVGLGMLLNLFRLKGTVDLDSFRSLKG